ncbi:acetyl-coenzyme a synthetase [Vairimorpha apis BRL 01]|uniref:acetate--CoA ligase n=1 Tax=Vairimorpha apis BRL 01 TaxID=1037528 RepID=T0MG52_9MICR|nr:acetyl-coenzyme a synthetase [Vairimorpha apis BRL 01]
MYGIEPVVISSSVENVINSCVINSCVSSSVNGVSSIDSIKGVNDANNIVVNNVSNVNIINTNNTINNSDSNNENIPTYTITPPKIAQPYELGHIAIKKPWPGMARGILNDPRRYNTYFNSSGYYITGDEGYKDNQNLFWIRGRADDVINVSGHRLSTAEIESATCVDPYVSEAAVVPVDDEITGQAVCIFVVPKYVIKGDVNTVIKGDGERCNESGLKDTVSGLMGNVNTVSGIVGNKMENTVNVNTINKDTVNKNFKSHTRRNYKISKTNSKKQNRETCSS